MLAVLPYSRPRRGMKNATIVPTRATPLPMVKMIRNASLVGIAVPPSITRCDEMMRPTTVAAIVDPRVRITELRPFAAAVSVGGTTLMMSVGIAE